MRQLIILLLAFYFMPCLKANENDLFTYDKEKVENALNNLSHIEKIVNENPGVEADDLLKTGAIEENSLSPSISPFSSNGEPPLGIPSFLWGCIFGVAGMIIVVIMTDKDKAEIKQALYGCITAYIAVFAFYAIIIYGSGGI